MHFERARNAPDWIQRLEGTLHKKGCQQWFWIPGSRILSSKITSFVRFIFFVTDPGKWKISKKMFQLSRGAACGKCTNNAGGNRFVSETRRILEVCLYAWKSEHMPNVKADPFSQRCSPSVFACFVFSVGLKAPLLKTQVRHPDGEPRSILHANLKRIDELPLGT